MNRFILILLLTISIDSFTQISHGGIPYSFNNTLSSNPPTYTHEIINIESLQKEDAITDLHKDIPWRFGSIVPVNLNLINSGVWEILPNGDRVWRLNINSPNATSINLNYNSFYIPKDASFFIYNDKTTLGAFTNANNKANGEFATALLKGEKITLEYYEPSTEYGNGVIQISSIVHGYRSLFDKLKGFGSSGHCNVNAVCDAPFWGNEIRSSVMLLTAGNSRFCSGALVNNTLQDGTPYILTADHCGPLSNNIFMFNYQSPDCSTNTDGPTTQTISGCTLIANDAPSDFFLLKLSSVPPANYNVFYSGWSNINTPPSKGTGIHYPAGDVKKISHDIDPIVEDGYYAIGNNHWKVNDWNSGTTEGGSSGSPLYDQNHRIVGQLHGGDATCGNDAFDAYGKFSFSWATNVDTLKQLQHWLDPNNAGTTVLDGYDPNGPQLVTDAILLNVEGIQNYICGDSASPMITIQNNGSSTLTSLSINYSLDGNPFTPYNWTGNLPPYGIDSINLPTLNFSNGNHTFTINCSDPNSATDQNLLNDSSITNFNANVLPLFATLNLLTDNYGVESSWLIRDNNSGATTVEGGGYSNIAGGQNFIDNLCLYDGCFTFVFKDSFGDGFCCGTNGNGSLLLTEDATGDTLAINNTFSSDSVTFSFCMGNATEINEIPEENFNIYPNPNNGNFSISSLAIMNKITVYDVLGKIIYLANGINKSNTTIDLGEVNKGLYIITIDLHHQVQKIMKIIIE